MIAAHEPEAAESALDGQPEDGEEEIRALELPTTCQGREYIGTFSAELTQGAFKSVEIMTPIDSGCEGCENCGWINDALEDFLDPEFDRPQINQIKDGGTYSLELIPDGPDDETGISEGYELMFKLIGGKVDE